MVTSLASYAEVGKLVPGVGFCHERERERSTNSSGISDKKREAYGAPEPTVQDIVDYIDKVRESRQDTMAVSK